jgi:hypothetical protein
MFKVIVERPRRGRCRDLMCRFRQDTVNLTRLAGETMQGEALGDEADPPDSRLDSFFLPACESTRQPRRRGWNRKELNENLKPLERFFGSAVGRPWDEVFAEVCESINVRSTVQKHVRDHVTDIVALRSRLDSAGAVEVSTAPWTRSIESPR